MDNIEPSQNNEETLSFTDFGFNENIMKAIDEAGFKLPSPIQAKAIPIIMQGRDIIAQAHTGTGKTAAFGLPIIHKLKHIDSIECLVITPTRELAMQVSEELYKLGKYDNTTVLTIYGGQPYKRQIDRIKTHPDIIVATPGRLLDLINKGYLKKLDPSTVILDEADEMLALGFLEPIEEIFSHFSKEKQTLLFSATMPLPIQKLAENILINPAIVSVTDGKKHTANINIFEMYAIIHEHERDDALIRLIDSEDSNKTIIFCRTKSEVDRLNTLLISHGYSAGCLHGDMEQNQRKKMISSFQAGSIMILVATDVAARGLDIKDVTHVFNFHIPYEPESYVHRIGRTGRAGKTGKAITLVNTKEYQKLKRFKKVIGGEMSHCIIPSLSQLTKISVDKVISEILQHTVSPLVNEYLKELTQVMPEKAIAEKLMSYIIDQLNLIGPAEIGLNLKETQNLINSNDSRGSFGDGRRRGRHSGGNRNYSRGRSGNRSSERKEGSGQGNRNRNHSHGRSSDGSSERKEGSGQGDGNRNHSRGRSGDGSSERKEGGGSSWGSRKYSSNSGGQSRRSRRDD